MLLSGGMDSATTLAIARHEGRDAYCLTVTYGQRHAREVASARALARRFRAREHRILRLPLAGLLRSALLDRSAALPSRRRARRGSRDRIPATYVPARNSILLSLALGYAESVGADELFIGANAIDYSGYPDCRPAFLRAFERLARVATRAGVTGRTRFRVRAPLLRLRKAQIVGWGTALQVPWELTWSCYAGGRAPCGRCDACRFRRKGFEAAGVPDPLLRPAGSAAGASRVTSARAARSR